MGARVTSGVILDSRLTLSAHVAVLCQAGYYQLRQLRTSVSSALEALAMMRYINLCLHYITLRTLVQSRTAEAAGTVPAAFISCRLDYCNSLLYGLPDTLLRKLQSVQNVTARLITGARRRNHNKPVLLELHWLPIRERVKFKLACLVRQSLFGQAPPYLTGDCGLVSDSTQRFLWSVDVPTCVVPRTLSSYGDRTFAAAVAPLWNSLPVQLCNRDITYERLNDN